MLNHVLLHQTIIGEEALLQLAKVGETPDLLVGCTGGGSNFGGLSFPFLREKLAGRMNPTIRCVEPAACPSLTKGEYRYDFGDTAGMTPLLKMHTLGHGFIPEPIHAGGLRYHGMSPLVSHLYELGLVEALAIPQRECFAAALQFARTEGIVPAPEPTHAIAATIREALACRDRGVEGDPHRPLRPRSPRPRRPTSSTCRARWSTTSSPTPRSLRRWSTCPCSPDTCTVLHFWNDSSRAQRVQGGSESGQTRRAGGSGEGFGLGLGVLVVVEDPLVVEALQALELVSRARGPGGLLHILPECGVLGLGVGGGLVAHLVAACDEIDEDPEVGQDDHEDHPQRLRPARQVVAAEDAGEHHDQDPDPDEEQEEPEERPEDLAGSPLGSPMTFPHPPVAVEARNYANTTREVRIFANHATTWCSRRDDRARLAAIDNAFLLPDRPVDSLAEHVAAGGGVGLQRAREMSPGALVQEVQLSHLRGRGGAGFPTGTKWASVAFAEHGTRYAVCNAAEGEPGTFKDRALLRANPYVVLEGLLIAAHAVGAEAAYLATKASFEREVGRLTDAVAEMTEAGWVDRPLHLVTGPEEYLFGEEKAMLEVIEGNEPLPRWLPPYLHGLFATAPQLGWEARTPGPDGPSDLEEANPTLVNNVETLANVAHILAKGPEWFRALGTEASTGTICCTVVGDVERSGVVEVELGTPLALVLDVCGGPPAGRAVRAVLSGVSSPVVVEAHLDVPVSYEGFEAIGSGLGSAGFIVYDDTTCMVEVAAMLSRFLAVESCGQCPPCKLGAGAITAALDRIARGAGGDRDLDIIAERLRVVTDGNRCYLPVEEQRLVASLLRAFPEDFAAHIETGRCPRPRACRSRRSSTSPRASSPTTSARLASAPTGPTPDGQRTLSMTARIAAALARRPSRSTSSIGIISRPEHAPARRRWLGSERQTSPTPAMSVRTLTGSTAALVPRDAADDAGGRQPDRQVGGALAGDDRVRRRADLVEQPVELVGSDPPAGRADHVQQGRAADTGRRPRDDLAVAVLTDHGGVHAVHPDPETLGQQVAQA